MMTFATATEAKSVTETVAYIVVRDSVFGALLILALFALYLLTVQLLRIQEKRVTDLQKLNERVEAREDSTRKLVDKMTEAFQQVKSSLDTLGRVGEKQAEATDSNTEVLRKVEGTLDSVIREHARTAAQVAGYRRPTPPTSSLPPKKGG